MVRRTPRDLAKRKHFCETKPPRRRRGFSAAEQDGLRLLRGPGRVPVDRAAARYEPEALSAAGWCPRTGVPPVPGGAAAPTAPRGRDRIVKAHAGAVDIWGDPMFARHRPAPRAHHRAVDVDRQARQREARDRVDDEIVVELHQRRHGSLRELAEPVTDGARRGDPRQPAEAGKEGIAAEIPKMLQPTGPDVEQRQDEQGEAAPAIVSARGRTGGAQSPRQLALPQVAPEQLQAAVRGQLLGYELDMPRPLDHPSQARYAQTHQRGLLCEGSNARAFSLSIVQGAFLLQICAATHHLFSDWG